MKVNITTQSGEILATAEIDAWAITPPLSVSVEQPEWRADLESEISEYDDGYVELERYGEVILGLISNVALAERYDASRLRSRLLEVAARATIQVRKTEELPSWMPEPYSPSVYSKGALWPPLAGIAHYPRELAHTAITLAARINRGSSYVTKAGSR